MSPVRFVLTTLRAQLPISGKRRRSSAVVHNWPYRHKTTILAWLLCVDGMGCLRRVHFCRYSCPIGGSEGEDWLMVRIHRKASCAGTRHARRPVSVILAAIGTMILAWVGSGCSHADAANPSVAASGAGFNSVSNPSAASSGPGGNSGSNCPTDGVGGDSLPPPCVPPAGTSADAASGTAPHAGISAGQRGGAVAAGPRPHAVVTVPTSASAPGLGIQGPASPSPTPSPGSPDGIAPPAAPSSPPPPNASSTTPPRVTGISPATGTKVGGNNVTITGSGFTDVTEVEFGSVRAVVTAQSDTEITVTSPPGSGTVDVTVVTPGGTSATNPADQFSYQS